MPSATHEAVVTSLVTKYQAETRRFASAMRKLYAEMEMDDFEGTVEWSRAFRFRPDAFLVKKDDGVVVCFEVHVSGSPSEKESAYVEAFWALDSIGFQLSLVNVDTGGNEAAVDLLAVWSELRKRGAA